jgi:hypothetical protein
MKLLLIYLFFLIPAHLSAPGQEIIPEWHYVSFNIEEGRIITKHGIYLRELPDGFLVYERKRKFGYEILLKEFKSIYYKRQR